MNQSQAADAVNASALILAGIYMYRKLVEPAVGAAASGAVGSPSAAGSTIVTEVAGRPVPTSLIALQERDPTGPGAIPAQLLGVGPVAPVSRFVVGWGFTYIVLALLVPVSPELAGGFAVLIAVGGILGNGVKVSTDIRSQLGANRQAAKTGTAAADAAPTVNVDFPIASAVGAAPAPANSGAQRGNRPSTHPRPKPRVSLA